jgi:hypothetical protein
MTDADEIRRELAGWRRNDERRDELVRAAHAAGIAKTEISQLMGISRVTINRILGLEEGGQQ